MYSKRNLQERISTFSLILNFFDKNALQGQYPALHPVLQSLRKKLQKVNDMRISHKPGRNSDLKKELRHSLATAAYHVSCGVYSYAQITGNAVLKNAVHYSFSDFYRPLETTMLGRCRQVLNAVRRVKNPEQFAITPQLIKKLEDEIEKYTNFMHVPEGEIKKHARNMRLANTLLNQCLTILQKQLDPLMVVIACSNQNIGLYNCLRRIAKPAGRKRKYVKSGKFKKDEKQPAIAAAPVHFNLSSSLPPALADSLSLPKLGI